MEWFILFPFPRSGYKTTAVLSPATRESQIRRKVRNSRFPLSSQLYNYYRHTKYKGYNSYNLRHGERLPHFTLNFSRHCVLSGGTERRVFPWCQNKEMKILTETSRIEWQNSTPHFNLPDQTHDSRVDTQSLLYWHTIFA